MLIALDSRFRRHGSRIAVGLAVFALAFAIVVAHGALGAEHMDASGGTPMTMVHGDHGGAAVDQPDVMHAMVAMCLAIAETAAIGFGLLAVIAALRLALALVRPRMPDVLPTSRPRMAAVPSARAGPAVLQVFLR